MRRPDPPTTNPVLRLCIDRKTRFKAKFDAESKVSYFLSTYVSQIFQNKELKAIPLQLADSVQFQLLPIVIDSTVLTDKSSVMQPCTVKAVNNREVCLNRSSHACLTRSKDLTHMTVVFAGFQSCHCIFNVVKCDDTVLVYIRLL